MLFDKSAKAPGKKKGAEVLKKNAERGNEQPNN